MLISFYIIIAISSIGATRRYLHKNEYTDYRLLASSPYAPTVSILAPAYNEGPNIVENVRSLLSLYYNHLELVVINDGSKDDSLQRLIDAYGLEKVDFFCEQPHSCSKRCGAYTKRGTLPTGKLVADKVNGKQSGCAGNVGINIRQP